MVGAPTSTRVPAAAKRLAVFVCFGSGADIERVAANVCYGPEADIEAGSCDVR